MLSLLFHFLDEWLYKFSANEFFIPRVSVLFGSFSICKLRVLSDNTSTEFNVTLGKKRDTTDHLSTAHEELKIPGQKDLGKQVVKLCYLKQQLLVAVIW